MASRCRNCIPQLSSQGTAEIVMSARDMLQHRATSEAGPAVRAFYRKGANGFTLIELLVVMAIIAMVVSVMVIQFGAYRMRVRDVQRERNMKELQKALELYVTTKRLFPEEASVIITGTDAVSAALVDAGAIPIVQPDPLNSGAFVYTYDSASGKTYTISYALETDSIPGKAKGPQVITP